jgi:hypothetical protein
LGSCPRPPPFDGLTFSAFSLGPASGIDLSKSLVSLTGASLNGPDVVLDITPMFAATVNGARDIAFGFTVTESVLGILFAVMRWRSNRTQPVIQLAGTPAKTMMSSIHSKPALRCATVVVLLLCPNGCQ